MNRTTGYSDGIDADCCRRVRRTNCDVEAAADALCLKTSVLLGTPAVTRDVVVRDCRLRSASNCFKLGTESTGDFANVTLSHCVSSGTLAESHDGSAAAEGAGITILTVDGGTIDGVVVSDVVMYDVVAPIGDGLLRVTGKRTDGVVLVGDHAETPGRVQIAPEVAHAALTAEPDLLLAGR